MGGINCDVAIVGGGITGLTLGWLLKRSGQKVVVLERGSVLGGALQTVRDSGYLLEIGPNTVLAGSQFLRLVSELDLDEELITASPMAKKRYLLCPDKKPGHLRLTALPTGPFNLIGNPHLPTRFYREILGEIFVPPLPPSPLDDESVRDFIVRRFGSYIADYLVSPLLSGIWAADTSRLSARSALEKLWLMEKNRGSVIKAMLTRSTSNSLSAMSGDVNSDPTSKSRRKMISFRSGLSALIEALQQKLGSECLRMQTSLLSFSPNEFGVTLSVRNEAQEETLYAKQVVLANSAVDCAELLRPHDPPLADLVSSVPSAPVGVMHLSIPRTEVRHPLDGFGFLCAPAYGKNVLGTIFSSSIFEGRAPTDRVLLTCFSGGALNPQLAEVTNTSVQNKVIADVGELLGFKSAPSVLGSYYYREAIPNYALGHFRVQEAVSRFETKEPRVLITGNWLRGISVADRIEQAAALFKVISGRF